jgi:hypothetical protein
VPWYKYDECFFCLGDSSVGMSPEDYRIGMPCYSLFRLAENATSRCASIAPSRLARAPEIESYAVLPSASRNAGFALSAAEIMASIVRPASLSAWH